MLFGVFCNLFENVYYFVLILLFFLFKVVLVFYLCVYYGFMNWLIYGYILKYELGKEVC